jgi:putative ABC transport system permease protein
MFTWSTTLRISLRALLVNKLRSFLTMLGIIIGVGSVITMLAVGMGASRQVEAQIASMGSNLMMVVPGSSQQGGMRMGFGTQPTLTLGDSEAILKQCSAVVDAAPVQPGGAQIVYGNMNWATRVQGTTQSMLVVRDWPLASGRGFTNQEIKSAAKVCILGTTVVENLFGAVDPVGQILRIKNLPFRVIGVLTEKGQSYGGDDQDDTIMVPVTTAQKKLFGTPFPGMVRMIMVKAASREALQDAQDQITGLLRQRHHIGLKQEDDFSIRNLTEFAQAAAASSRVMTLLLAAVASVSLLVGGIGIMNIMFVTVSERTREIGLRRAVGARRWDIRLQFLIEALALSFIGGIIGVFLGLGSSWLISANAGWPVIFTPFSILLSYSFSGLVGLFFGFYPAHKASMLNPIDALRYE